MWTPGTTLHDRPAYLRSESPVVRVERSVAVDGGELRAMDARFVLAYQAERLWSRQVQVATTVDVDEVVDRASEFEAAIDRAGTLSIVLVFMADYQTDRYEGTLESTTPIVLDGNAFELRSEPLDDRRSTMATGQQSRSPDWGTVVGRLAIGVFGMGGAAGAVRYRRRDPSLEVIRRERIRARYDDWISDGALPDNGGYDWIKMATLGDLVNYAIDANGRVVYDSRHRRYGVLDGGVIYYSEEPYQTELETGISEDDVNP